MIRLSFRRRHLIEKINKIREKQYKITYSKYGEYFNNFNKNKSFLLKDLYKFQNQNDTDECKEMINNLPILYYPQEKKHIKKETGEFVKII